MKQNKKPFTKKDLRKTDAIDDGYPLICFVFKKFVVFLNQTGLSIPVHQNAAKRKKGRSHCLLSGLVDKVSSVAFPQKKQLYTTMHHPGKSLSRGRCSTACAVVNHRVD